jgi:hypothetical protein
MSAHQSAHQHLLARRRLAREECSRRARSRPSSAYLLFTGSRVVSVRAEPVLDAAGSPASGEEGFAPAGSVFAAGVLAFAVAVPEVAFSPLGVPAASNDEIGAAARASAKAKVHVCSALHFLLVARTGATTRLQRQGEWGWWCHLLRFTLIRPTLPATPPPIHTYHMTIVTTRPVSAQRSRPRQPKSKCRGSCSTRPEAVRGSCRNPIRRPRRGLSRPSSGWVSSGGKGVNQAERKICVSCLEKAYSEGTYLFTDGGVLRSDSADQSEQDCLQLVFEISIPAVRRSSGFWPQITRISYGTRPSPSGIK